ncbi:hypothetical protein PR202_ga27542 [Eleusine coracana subsp. coracana]|uniref:Multiple C2 domain-containing protein n=1 Tax=Eleusine coracana subsp. coracana TaxID=191504 RepID=A0AAV5DG85_ELECO|nr:hypothetical protein PR202_ga27542 [Eleusine coracana subsp. coracana]
MNRVHTTTYPLLVLLWSGPMKMGELRLAMRFSSTTRPPLLDSSLLPCMHYQSPIGVVQQEQLCRDAVSAVAAWMERSEPPLRSEVVLSMLHEEDAHTWSAITASRHPKVNWFRIMMKALTWFMWLVQWLDSVRRWRSPSTTLLIHAMYLALVAYPVLAVPMMLDGVLFHYKFRRHHHQDHTHLTSSSADDLKEEEFDPSPPADMLRLWYEWLWVQAHMVDLVLGDIVGQGERLRSLLSWRDPRTSRIFVCVCVSSSLSR